MPLSFRLLGPLEVWEDGREISLGTGRQRALLALLLVHSNELVSADRLIEELWAGNPPASASKVLQGYVSQVRRALPPETIATQGPGYVLAAGETDADEFARLVEEASTLEPGEAAPLLRRALGLWRGRPLAEFEYEDWAQAAIARLEEQRLAALEERIDADLELGRHARVVAELEALVAEHPLRERLRGQLMLALYRCGRQADALEVYRQGRRALVDELGLEPSPFLEQLEKQILTHDDALAAPPRRLPVPPALARRGRLIALAGALVLAGAVAAAAWQLAGGTGRAVHLQTLGLGRCSPVAYEGPGTPQLLIAGDLPLQRGLLATTTPMVEAMTLALARRGYRAGRFRVGLQVCDDAQVRDNLFSDKACAANAGAFAADRSVIGVVGPYASGCAAFEIPILNAALGGAVAVVSPTNTLVGLTRQNPETATGEPGAYYPSGRRNYARVIPADDVQGAADAILARRLGVTRAYVLDDGGNYGVAVAAPFTRTARRLGIAVVGRGSWNVDATSYGGLAATVARTRPDGIFLAGTSAGNAIRFLRELRSRLGRSVRFVAPDGFDPYTAALAGAAAEGMVISKPYLTKTLLGRAGREFVASFSHKMGEEPTGFALNAAQAMDVLLDAIARSDGTRASVTKNLFTTRISNGILGSFFITRTGDTTLNTVSFSRIVHGKVTRFTAIVVPDDLVPGM